MANLLGGASIWGSVRTYTKNKWIVKASRAFTKQELAVVKNATVEVGSNGYPVVCVHYVDGNQSYLNPARDSTAQVGDEVDMAASSLIELQRPAPQVQGNMTPEERKRYLAPQIRVVAHPVMADNVGLEDIQPQGLGSTNIFGAAAAPKPEPEQVPETVNQVQAAPAPAFDMSALADMIAQSVSAAVDAKFAAIQPEDKSQDAGE